MSAEHYTPPPTASGNEAQVVTMEELRVLRQKRLQQLGAVASIAADSTEATTGMNVEGIADKVDRDVQLGGSHDEAADTVANVVDLTAPNATTHEINTETQEIADRATQTVENAGIDADVGEVTEAARQRVTAQAIEDGARGVLSTEHNEATTDEGQETASDAVAAEVIAHAVEAGDDQGLSKKASTNLKAQLIDKNTDNMSNRELAAAGEEAVKELENSDGVEQTIRLYDADYGADIEVKVSTADARDVRKVLAGHVAEVTRDWDANDVDHLMFKLDDLHEAYGKDLLGALQKGRMEHKDFLTIQRIISRAHNPDSDMYLKHAA